VAASKERRRRRYDRRMESIRASGLGSDKRAVAEADRTDRFRRLQRLQELNELEAERQKRIGNVEAWAAEQRRKIHAKYEGRLTVDHAEEA